MKKGHLILVLKLAVTVAALAYLFASDKLHLEQLIIRPGGWGMIAGAVGLIFAWRILSQIRYWFLLRSAGVELPLGRVLQVGCIGWFFNATLLGGLGFVSEDAVRAAYLVKEKGRGSVIVSASVVDRILGILGLMTLAVFALQVGWHQTVQSPELRTVAAAIYGAFATMGLSVLTGAVSLAIGRTAAIGVWAVFGGAVAVLLAMIWGDPLVPGLMLLVSFVVAVTAPALLPGRGLHRVIVERVWMGRAIGSLLEVFLDYRKRMRALLGGYALSIGVHVLSLSAIAVVALGISLEVVPTLRQVWFAAPPATVLNVVPLPANGLGVGEAAFDAMLRFCAAPDGDPLAGGAALYLSYRILLTLSGLSGLPFYLFSRRGNSPERSLPEENARGGEGGSSRN